MFNLLKRCLCAPALVDRLTFALKKKPEDIFSLIVLGFMNSYLAFGFRNKCRVVSRKAREAARSFKVREIIVSLELLLKHDFLLGCFVTFPDVAHLLGWIDTCWGTPPIALRFTKCSDAHQRCDVLWNGQINEFPKSIITVSFVSHKYVVGFIVL